MDKNRDGRLQGDIYGGSRTCWEEFKEQCPGGACSQYAILNGYDVNGRTWVTGVELAPVVVGFNSGGAFSKQSSPDWGAWFYRHVP